MGGQGGGVLTGWIEDLARAQRLCRAGDLGRGRVAAHRGHDLLRRDVPRARTARPVFSLMPAAGDVDIMIAAEMMEAGRAIIRGFVTPDRTTLIASTHRVLAVSEKIGAGRRHRRIGRGRWPPPKSPRAAVMAADFDALAVEAGSVISASLFGALAASGALPFPREAFEAAIRAGGKGVEGSLRAFAAGLRGRRASAPARRRRVAKPRPRRQVRLAPPGCWPNGTALTAPRRRYARPGARHGRCPACARSSISRTSPMAPSILTGSTRVLPQDAPPAATC